MTDYPFIDIAVLDGVREPFAEARPVLVLDRAGRVVWANAAGAGLIGLSAHDAVGTSLGGVAARQVAAGARALSAGRTARAMVRLSRPSGWSAAALVPVTLTGALAPGGVPVTVLAAEGAPTAHTTAEEVLRAFELGTAAAVFAEPGPPLAATPAFEAIAPDIEDLIALRDEVAGDGEGGRTVKRALVTRDGPRPAGIARLRDAPRLDLVLVVETGEAARHDGSDAERAAEVGAEASEPEVEAADAAPHPDLAQLVAAADALGATPRDDAPRDTEPLPPPATDAGAESGADRLTARPIDRASDRPSERASRPSFSDAPGIAPAPRPDGLMPLRFAWRSDGAGRFTGVDAALTRAVGLETGALDGRVPGDVVALLPADRERLAASLTREDAFSNRTVAWGVPEAGLRVPVAFSAIPHFGADGTFKGHRGFGMVRLGDAVLDDTVPETALLTDAAEPEDVPGPDAPAPGTNDPDRSASAGTADACDSEVETEGEGTATAAVSSDAAAEPRTPTAADPAPFLAPLSIPTPPAAPFAAPVDEASAGAEDEDGGRADSLPAGMSDASPDETSDEPPARAALTRDERRAFDEIGSVLADHDVRPSQDGARPGEAGPQARRTPPVPGRPDGTRDDADGGVPSLGAPPAASPNPDRPRGATAADDAALSTPDTIAHDGPASDDGPSAPDEPHRVAAHDARSVPFPDGSAIALSAERRSPADDPTADASADGRTLAEADSEGPTGNEDPTADRGAPFGRRLAAIAARPVRRAVVRARPVARHTPSAGGSTVEATRNGRGDTTGAPTSAVAVAERIATVPAVPPAPGGARGPAAGTAELSEVPPARSGDGSTPQVRARPTTPAAAEALALVRAAAESAPRAAKGPTPDADDAPDVNGRSERAEARELDAASEVVDPRVADGPVLDRPPSANGAPAEPSSHSLSARGGDASSEASVNEPSAEERIEARRSALARLRERGFVRSDEAQGPPVAPEPAAPVARSDAASAPNAAVDGPVLIAPTDIPTSTPVVTETTDGTDASEAIALTPEAEAPAADPDPPRFADGALDGAEVVDLVPSLGARRPRAARPVDTRLLDDLPLPVLVQDRTGLLHANPPFLKLTGYPSLAALAGAGGVAALFDGAPAPAEPGAEAVPMRLLRADGTARPVAAQMQSVPWRAAPDGDADGRALLLSVRPLDERGRALPGVPDAVAPGAVEDRLAALNAVLDEATDGVVFLDEERRIRSLSRSAEALLGYGDADVRGRSFAVLFAPDSQREAVDLVASLGGVGPRRRSGLELDALTADDREVPLFVTVGAMRDGGGYCAVLRDVSDWRERVGELRDVAEAAEEGSRRKSRFLARVSHEIRTPLNAIIGFAEVMAEERLGPVGNPKYREYLADIRSSGRHVLDLVNDLLDIARIEAGREDLRFEAVELGEVLREALALLHTQAAEGRILVRTDLNDVPPVVADRRSLKQVALNVLTNAVNFTGPGGQVIVSLRRVEGGVTVRIRDTGIGMDEGEIARALEPFGEAPPRARDEHGADDGRAGRSGRSRGVGLGLPLSKAMAEANRARFAISSVRGRGTLVELHFPRERVLD